MSNKTVVKVGVHETGFWNFRWCRQLWTFRWCRELCEKQWWILTYNSIKFDALLNDLCLSVVLCCVALPFFLSISWMMKSCIALRGMFSITRITRVNNICFCYIAISNNISTRADFEVDGYNGCWLTLGAHAQEGYGSWVCVCVCLSVCLSVC